MSTTDPEARVMKMANGGFNPAVNVQLATDTESRAIVGVDVSNEGYDAAGLSEPMRQQVEQRTGSKVEQHLMDGGYLRMADIEKAHEQGVELFVPPKPAKNKANRGRDQNPSRGTAKLSWNGRSAWPAKKENRFTSKEARPVKPSTVTCGLIAGLQKSWFADWARTSVSSYSVRSSSLHFSSDLEAGSKVTR